MNPCFKNDFVLGMVQEVKNCKEFQPISKIHEMLHRSYTYRASLSFSFAWIVIIAKSFLKLSQYTSQTLSFVWKCYKSLD